MRIPYNLDWQPAGNPLGEGGQGEVIPVTEKGDFSGEKYAMKILNNVDSEAALFRFHQEVEAISEVEHPFIIQIVDYSDREDDFQFYVMDYFEDATSLYDIIHSDDNHFHGDVHLCLELFEKIISAIQACEQLSPPIVHRDISPNNILVLEDDSIRLIDFGICQIEDGRTITLTDESFGTRNYAAPECEAGNDSDITVRSDIYSAAKVLWSAITSKEAFAREQPVFQNLSMKEMFPNSPETWILDLIFERSIRKEPENRFPYTVAALDLVGELIDFFQRGHSSVEDTMLRCPGCGCKNKRTSRDRRARGQFAPEDDTESFICFLCGLKYTRTFMSEVQANRRRYLD